MAVFPALAAELAVFEFHDQTGTQLEQEAATVAPGITVSALKRGDGLTLPPETPGTFSAAGWSTDTSAFARNDYLEFTISPDAGSQMTLTELQFVETVNKKGPIAFTVRSSLDQFSSDLIPHVSLDAQSPSNEHSISLGEDFANLQGPVTFRFYAYGTRSGSNGIWGLGRPGEQGSLLVHGTIE